MSEKQTVTIVQEVDAPVSQVYRAVSSSQGFQEWMGDVVEADGREGGRFYSWWNAGFYASGTFVHVEENHKIAFSWFGSTDKEISRVRFLLEEQDGGTKVTLFHDDVVPEAVETYTTEWENSLANLKSVLETGVDKRQYDRPMLGFWVGGLVNDALIERLELPVDYGVHVAGLLDGMGAERSGLLRDDVIASIDGKDIRTFQSIGDILGKFKGGDVVPTVVYRGPEKIDMDVELSKRPVPDFPPAPAELAELGSSIYKDLLGDLKAVLEGVTEEEANQKPAEGEWNVKEVLAHLLVSERWSHAAWDLHPKGGKLPNWAGSDRTYAAVANVYTLDNLLKELKYSIKLNLEMIETLPDEFVANKGTYFLQLQNYEQGIRTHFQQHTDQIKAAIEAVRQGEPELAPA